jgi:hypothetical protein
MVIFHRFFYVYQAGKNLIIKGIHRQSLAPHEKTEPENMM